MNASGPGPHALLSRSRGAQMAIQSYANHLRQDSPLPGFFREVAIVVTARCWGSTYVRNQHLDRAMAAGMSATLRDALDRAGPLRGDNADERLIIDLCQRLRHHVNLGEAMWTVVTKRLGVEAAIDLLMVAFVYRGVAGLAETAPYATAMTQTEQHGE